MRSRYLVIILLSAIIFAVIFAQQMTGSLGSQPEKAAERAVVRTSVSIAVEPKAIQEMQRQDGSAVLEQRCSQCHTAQTLEQIKQPRDDWEKSLVKMETFGVHLDDAEKAGLLDFLAGDERP